MDSGFDENDVRWMRIALGEAERALERDEVPVGAVIIRDERVIGRGHNQVESLNDPTAHAEIIAIGAAGSFLSSWRLEGASIYVTLEPCAMCAGAILDPKAGACGSVLNITEAPSLNHRVSVHSGVLAEEAGSLLRTFFEKKRRDARVVESGGLENR
jgi:tRNA(adenine34) deaminase